MKKICFTLVFVMACGLVFAGGGDGNSKRVFRKGRMYFKRNDYIRSSPFLKQAFNLDPDKAGYAIYAGKSVFLGDQPRESLKYFVAAYNLDRDIAEDINYYLARAMHHNGMFEEAITHYQADLSRHEADSPIRRDTEARIAQCKNAPMVVNTPVDFKIENLGEFVNTVYPEYASTFTGQYDYMIFTTRRPRRLSELVRRRFHVEDINEEVYEATNVNGTWMKGQLFKKPIPRWQHDASIALSADGNTMIYYVDNRNYGDVYVSKNEDGKWSKRVSIGDKINSEKYNEPSVYITPDGKQLYWVSDKPDGVGLKDIYISDLQPDGTWGEGRPGGPNINSAYDDDAPFLSPDGKRLYFSSRGHSSIGGYDLFYCDKLADGNWGKPKNMGVPINSFSDDIYIVTEGNGKEFFFTSDRPGGFGEKDLYHAAPFTPEENPNTTIVAGIVADKVSNKPLEAEVRLINKITDEVLATTNTDPKDGSYRFVLPACGIEYKIDVKVPACSPSAPATTGKFNIVSGRIQDALTEAPLDATVELVDNATNEVVDIYTTNPKTGNYLMAVESGRRYTLRVKSNEYLSYYEEFSVAPTGELISHYDIIGLQKQNEPNKLVITWQFFDVDKSIIKADYYRDLDNVVTVLNKVKNMDLNIIGHTDSDASEEHNIQLSQSRAEAVAKYLTDHGIDKARLNVAGLGEAMPIYPNSNPEWKKWNRRVELYLISR